MIQNNVQFNVGFPIGNFEPQYYYVNSTWERVAKVLFLRIFSHLHQGPERREGRIFENCLKIKVLLPLYGALIIHFCRCSLSM